MQTSHSKLLLVEPREAARELLSEHFRMLGYEVVEAHSLSEAGMYLQHGHVDVCLVSLQSAPSHRELHAALGAASNVVYLGPKEFLGCLGCDARTLSEPFDLNELERSLAR